MALHTGEAELHAGDYYGTAVNRCARLRGIAYGEQVLMSRITAELARGKLPVGVQLRDLGLHYLKDIDEPERVFQLVHPELRTEFPPPQSLTTRRTNLPVPMTSFIGRDAELQTLRQLLSETRLLTLTGSGGAGKTRLAMQVGAELADVFDDGVWLVELAPLSDAALVAQAVATELGLSDESEGRPVARVTQHLKLKRTLLVLDNCEHLIEACAEFAEAVLRACPKLCVVATSREPLRAAGEVAWRIPSMRVPPAAIAEVEDLRSYESVRLFAARARGVVPNFELTAANAHAVGDICRGVDGIPLAIELAAARVRMLGVDQIAERLAGRLRLLSNGNRTAPERHRTLRATLDWSYDLLTPAERELMVRLAVFAGGWTIEAAEDVTPSDTLQQPEVLDVLSRLVDKSLVVIDAEADGTVRYRLLDSVREYALERFAVDDCAALTHERHARYFASLAEHADLELRGPRQLYWIRRLEREHDNLRAALAWSTGAGTNDLGLRMVAALTKFWQIRGYLSEGRGWLTAALERDSGSLSVIRARAVHGLGVLAMDQGDVTFAYVCYRQSIDLFRDVGDGAGLAMALNGFAGSLRRRGMLDEARAHYQRSLELARANGDRVTTAAVLNNLAALEVDLGQLERATQALTEAAQLFRQLDEADGRGYALTRLGDIARRRGDYSRARAYCDEALAVFRELGHKVGIRWTLSGLADIARNVGQPAVARGFVEEALGVAREVGNPERIAYTLVSLGALSMDEGDFATARVLVDEGLATFPDASAGRSVGWALMIRADVARCEGDFGAACDLYRRCLEYLRVIPMAPLPLEGVATLMTALGQSVVAARLLGAATAVRQSLGTPLPPAQQAQHAACVASLRASLGAELYESGLAEGARLSTQEALDYAAAAVSVT
jgi:predicted ATPase